MRTDRGRQRFYAAGWVISAGVMVVASRVWRLHLREVEQRAEEAERTRDEVARRRAVEERLRIARELHDSLTHSISVICVQSGVAVHLARKRGEEVSPALLAIQEASADAARELRTTLGVLRSDGGRRQQRPRPPGQPGGTGARAGLPVTVNVTGAERALPPEVDQAAYRIVQEALTNVSRHAGRPRAWSTSATRRTPSRSRSTTTAPGTSTSAAPATAGGTGPRARPHRHARTGNRARRPAARRPEGRRRLPGPRRNPGAGHRVLIRILLADDQALIRSGIRSLLEAEDDIEVVAEATDGRQAVTLAAEHRPDIALVDIQMPVLLANREREVVALVTHGLSNDEIAGAMLLSPATAKSHVSRAMIKLGARDRAQLVVFAYQACW